MTQRDPVEPGVSEPEISVVIPAYNAAKTLGEQLDALTAAAIPFAWEILVCDNGSLDGTADVVADFHARFPQIRLVDASARRGPGAARNIGVDAARAPLIAFCDADDWADPGWIEGARTALAEHEFVAGYLQWAHQVRRAGVVIEHMGAITTSPVPELPAASSSNLAIRREIYLAVGGFNEVLRSGEDLDFCWRVQLAGHRLVHVAQMRLHLRRREGFIPSFRQGYSYGVGDRQLVWRYERVVAAYRAQAPAAEMQQIKRVGIPRRKVSDTVRDLSKVLVRTFTHGLFRIASREGRADLAWAARRPGRRLGYFARQDLSRIEQVEPPPGLLPRWPAVSPDRVDVGTGPVI